MLLAELAVPGPREDPGAGRGGPARVRRLCCAARPRTRASSRGRAPAGAGGRRALGLLDLARRFVDSGDEGVELIGADRTRTHARGDGAAEVLHGACDAGRGAVEPVVDVGHPAEDPLDDGFLLVERGRAGLGDAVELLAALGVLHGDVAELFEQGQRRVDHAGARRIGAPDLVLDGLDDLVAVTGRLADQLEDHEAQVALIEHARSAAHAHAAEPSAMETELARGEGFAMAMVKTMNHSVVTPYETIYLIVDISKMRRSARGGMRFSALIGVLTLAAGGAWAAPRFASHPTIAAIEASIVRDGAQATVGALFNGRRW